MERISFKEMPKGMYQKIMDVENFISESSLEYHLVELIKLRVGQINHCSYCVDMHYKELRHLGETELRLSSLSIWNETPYFTDKEKVVLKFTEALTKINQERINDEIYEPLLKYFDKEEICYLSLTITQINTWSRLMPTFRITPGQYKVPVETTLV